jgi:hypothetical protein
VLVDELFRAAACDTLNVLDDAVAVDEELSPPQAERANAPMLHRKVRREMPSAMDVCIGKQSACPVSLRASKCRVSAWLDFDFVIFILHS